VVEVVPAYYKHAWPGPSASNSRRRSRANVLSTSTSNAVHHNAEAPLTHGEALFILHLMTFKWDEALPYRSYKTLSRLMGVDQKTVQRYAQSLCRKKHLFCIFQPKGANRFDLIEY
jgi:hypothetical protein